MRPKKYFVIPKESLERFLDDAEQLINFFVIEFQRVIFAENVYVTTGVRALSCLLSSTTPLLTSMLRLSSSHSSLTG